MTAPKRTMIEELQALKYALRDLVLPVIGLAARHTRVLWLTVAVYAVILAVAIAWTVAS